MRATENKAVLSMEDGFVIYSEESVASWRISISEIAIIGEYTTSNGPYIDDYFVVFVMKPEMVQYHGSFYAIGLCPLLESLSKQLGAKVDCGLGNSADLASRCMWPPSLAGQPLFAFTVIPSGNAWWSRILRWLSPEYKFDYTPNVESYLSTLDFEKS